MVAAESTWWPARYCWLIADHYECLGVPFSASRDEIRSAYRQLARQHHPDAKGEASAVRMAQINEAWRVLSDPGLRAAYDAQSRASAEPRSSANNGSAVRPEWSSDRHASAMTLDWSASRQHASPARFPWRFMLGIASVGIAFVLVNAALTKPATERVPDNLMEVGSCVDILDNGDAKEVLCSGNNDGVVAELHPISSICARGTELHRDRQGMGDVCVRIAGG